MQQILKEASIPYLKTFCTNNKDQAAQWLANNRMEGRSFIIKPPASAGSDKLFHINKHQDWLHDFNTVLAAPSLKTGKSNEAVILKEETIGTEYAIDTVSCTGKHVISHIIKYHKKAFDCRKTIYDHVEFVIESDPSIQELINHTNQVLDKLRCN